MCMVGFFVTTFNPFTEDCLYRISRAISPINLKAISSYLPSYQEKSRFPYYPSFVKGRFWGVTAEGSTPEGFASNINWHAARRCVGESDIIVFLGLQGATALAWSFEFSPRVVN